MGDHLNLAAQRVAVIYQSETTAPLYAILARYGVSIPNPSRLLAFWSGF